MGDHLEFEVSLVYIVRPGKPGLQSEFLEENKINHQTRTNKPFSSGTLQRKEPGKRGFSPRMKLIIHRRGLPGFSN